MCTLQEELCLKELFILSPCSKSWSKLCAHMEGASVCCKQSVKVQLRCSYASVSTAALMTSAGEKLPQNILLLLLSAMLLFCEAISQKLFKLTLEDRSNRLSRNIGMKLPLQK